MHAVNGRQVCAPSSLARLLQGPCRSSSSQEGWLPAKAWLEMQATCV